MKLFAFPAGRWSVWKLPRRAIFKALGDAALVGTGMAMAAGSVVFAAAMFLEGDHAPRVNGMQYLAIFAKPRGASRPTVAEAPAVAATDQRVAGNAVDMTPTGSIGADTTEKAPSGSPATSDLDMAPTGSIAHEAPDAPNPAENYRILAVEPDMAWLTRGGEIRAVKPGDVAPGLGRVASITRREGRWVLLGDDGQTLLKGDPQAPKDVGRGGDSPFARRMIFGGD
jgi:hypothetical protein